MTHFIIKIKDMYLEWSTISDSPITFGMTKEQLEKRIKLEYGEAGLSDLPARLQRVEHHGTSLPGDGLDVIEFNRAGPNEKKLSVDEIYTAYCERIPIRDNWIVPMAHIFAGYLEEGER